MSGQLTNAAAFFGAATLAERDVQLPDGLSIKVRELSILQRAEFSHQAKEDPSKLGAWLCVQACLDEHGFRMFADDQVGELMLKSPRLVEHVARAVMRLSGLAKDDEAGNA